MENLIPEGILSGIRRWRGGIGDRFNCIDNLLRHLAEHQSQWNVPPDMLSQLADSHSQLEKLTSKCRSLAGSTADRMLRDSLLGPTVRFCRIQVKAWAHGQYSAGVLTAEEVHMLGFLLPGEIGGHRSRREPTREIAEVKVHVLGADFIRVVVDQSGDKNAARVAHGWPAGVRNALIVIVAADGTTEVCRRVTTRLHNDICMPAGSHGRPFIIKAAFLRHVSDEPHFGSEQTFSMPLTTEDLLKVESF
jgi:hypothetical protein